MRLYREDRAELARLDELHSAKASGEEVLHPPLSTEVFESADDLEDAYSAGRLRPFPDEPGRNGLRRDPRMGELARRLNSERHLYRGLRPEALALAIVVGLGRQRQTELFKHALNEVNGLGSKTRITFLALLKEAIVPRPGKIEGIQRIVEILDPVRQPQNIV